MIISQSLTTDRHYWVPKISAWAEGAIGVIFAEATPIAHAEFRLIFGRMSGSYYMISLNDLFIEQVAKERAR